MVSRWLPRAALVSAAAGALSITMATAAWASVTTPLHDDHQDSTAAGFETHDCDDFPFTLPSGYDGWHFVLPDGTNDFEEVNLEFKDGTDQTVNITIKNDGDADPYPDELKATGSAQVKHAYVATPAGWTLVDGSAQTTETADFFNLSHTCAGTPTTPPEEKPTTPSTGTSTTPNEDSTSPAATTTAAPGSDDSLPLTGAATGGIALAGLALIGGGAALVFLRRRRDKVTFTA